MHSLKKYFLRPSRLRLRTRERILFAKRVALYLRSGIPIVEALDLILGAPGSAAQKRLLKELLLSVQSGMPLSRAFSRFPHVYSPAQLQLIAIGEASGTLPRSLASLANTLEERERRIRSIIGSLAYPAILLAGALGVSIFLLAYAFPKIVPIFRGLHTGLPFTTRALMHLSSILQDHWLLIVCGVAGMPLLIIFACRISRVQKHIDMFMLRLPLFGRLFRALILTNIFRALSVLLESGVRLDEAILFSSEGTSNLACRAALERIRGTILSGSKLSAAMGQESFLFAPVALQLASVGEMTGSLSGSMASAAQIFEEELSERLHFLSVALEPLIMVVMGLVIGFIALAIISPMYGITQSLLSS